MSKPSKQISVRLTETELRAIDQLQEQQGLTRAEAIRTAIGYGLPLAHHGHALDIVRLAMCIERMQAMLDMIVHREHPDAVGRLEEIARERVINHHLPR